MFFSRDGSVLNCENPNFKSGKVLEKKIQFLLNFTNNFLKVFLFRLLEMAGKFRNQCNFYF